MAFFSVDDSDFWGRDLGPQQAVIDQGGHEGLVTSYFVLGKVQEDPPLVTPMRMAPGFVLPRHAHDCHRMEIVVQGSMDVGDRILGPGCVMITGPGEPYGPHVAGPEGCLTFEIFSNYEGAHRMLLEASSGEMVAYDLRTSENAQAVVENKKQQQASFAMTQQSGED